MRNLRRMTGRATGRPNVDYVRRAGGSIGVGVRIGRGVHLDGVNPGGVTVGDGARLDRGAVILAHDASMKLVMGWTQVGKVRIGAGAHIGERAVVLCGVTVGDDARVLPDSVVTEDVPPAVTVGGRPARAIGAASTTV